MKTPPKTFSVAGPTGFFGDIRNIEIEAEEFKPAFYRVQEDDWRSPTQFMFLETYNTHRNIIQERLDG